MYDLRGYGSSQSWKERGIMMQVTEKPQKGINVPDELRAINPQAFGNHVDQAFILELSEIVSFPTCT